MFERMLQYREKFGDCNVPKRYLPDLALGSWVHTQRIQYRKVQCLGDKKVHVDSEEETNKENASAISLDRKRRLDDVNFAWSARDFKKSKTGKREGSVVSECKPKSYDLQWNEMLEKLKEYKETEGDTLVPKRYKDKRLGTWVDTQRVQVSLYLFTHLQTG